MPALLKRKKRRRMKNSGQWSVISGQFIRAYCGTPLFFILLALFLTISLAACNRSGEAEYLKGEKLWEEGKYVEALAQYEKVVEHDPKGRWAVDALYQTGNIYLLNLKDYKKAVMAYRMLVDANPKSPFSPDAQKKIAEIHRDKFGDIKGAVREYKRFVTLYPKEADKALLQIAHCYMLIREFDGAREALGQILKDAPEIDYKDEVYYQTANSFYLEGKTGEARKWFDELLKTFPESKFAPDAKLGIALAYEEAGDLQEALNRLIQLKGAYPNQTVLELRIAGIRERIEARKRPVQASTKKRHRN